LGEARRLGKQRVRAGAAGKHRPPAGRFSGTDQAWPEMLLRWTGTADFPKFARCSQRDRRTSEGRRSRGTRPSLRPIDFRETHITHPGGRSCPRECEALPAQLFETLNPDVMAAGRRRRMRWYSWVGTAAVQL